MVFLDKVGELLSRQVPPLSKPQDVLAHLGAPSVSVAVLDHGTIEAHCFSTLSHDTETVFQACSISKPVCAVAVARLVDAGRLPSLDAKILHHLPSHILKSLGPLDLVKQITLKQLLSHTSGLGVWGFNGYPPSSPLPSTEEIVLGRGAANTMPVTLEAFPGKQFRYSGGGFMVLQLALETMFGKPFQDIVRETVFEPLGMTRSFYAIPDGEKNLANCYSTGFAKYEHSWTNRAEQAAGGLWTTPTDLLKFIHAVQKSVRQTNEDSTRFLSKAIAQEILTEVRDGMGLGWFLAKSDGNSFNHPGDNRPGFSCHVAGYADVAVEGASADKDIVPESGVAVMTNSAAGPSAYFAVLHAITYLKGWPPLQRPALGPSFWVPLPDPARTLDERWSHWVGSWSDGWTLKRGDDSMPLVQQGYLPKQKLVPVAMTPGKFQQGESVDLLVEGMRVMLRLRWDSASGKDAIEVWNGLTEKSHQLERAE